MVKIALPPRGYMARDLVISTLYELGEGEPEIEGDFAEVEENRDKLKEMIIKFRQDSVASKLVSSNVNYGKIASYILEKDINTLVDEFFKESEEDFSYRLILPEFMEAERWYGGWDGKESRSKSKKKATIRISMQSAILATLALSLFRVFNYREKVGEKKWITVLGIAPVDSVMQYLCKSKNLISEERVSTQKLSRNLLLDKLSQLGRIFLFAMYYSDNVCQKLVVMKVSQRADVVEDVSYPFIEPLIEVWKQVNSQNQYFREDLTKLITNGDYVEVFNRIANYVFEAVSGVISPEQMEYFIARDTYLKKDENLGFITPNLVKHLREAVKGVVRRGIYSA